MSTPGMMPPTAEDILNQYRDEDRNRLRDEIVRLRAQVESVRECAALFKRGGTNGVYESAEEIGQIILESLEEDG